MVTSRFGVGQWSEMFCHPMWSVTVLSDLVLCAAGIKGLGQLGFMRDSEHEAQCSCCTVWAAEIHGGLKRVEGRLFLPKAKELFVSVCGGQCSLPGQKCRDTLWALLGAQGFPPNNSFAIEKDVLADWSTRIAETGEAASVRSGNDF